ncbi:MAG: hypothetical protein H7249_09845 [Chitinophagaceae bacterium]|nr:hypothetical protein [Oligoflexus sp.]
MDRKTFNEVVHKVPHLAADGLLVIGEPEYLMKRREFVTNAMYLQETIDAVHFLQGIGKSTRFSEWQRAHCTPEGLKALVEWHVGHEVSNGAIVAAALYLGFTMGVQDGTKVYFNFLAPQVETEFAQLRTLEQIRQVARA